MRNPLFVFLALVCFVLACQSKDAQKPEYFIFRTDYEGFQVIIGQYSKVFTIFYENELDSQIEQQINEFGKQHFNQDMIALALDFKENQQLAEFFKVVDPNQILIMKNGNPILKSQEQNFEEWALNILTPKIFHLDTSDDLQILLNTYETNSAVLYLKEGDTESLDLIKNYIQNDIFSQNSVENVYYYDIDNENKQNTGNSTLAVLKTSPYEQEQKVIVYTDELQEVQSLIDFLRISTLPVITKLSDDTFLRVFGSPVGTQVLLFKSKNEKRNDQMIELFEKAALYNLQEQLFYQRGIFSIVENNEENEYMFKNFMLEDIYEPTIVVTKTEHSSFQFDKFKQEDQFKNDEELIQFIEDVQLKKVDPYYQSEDIPDYEEIEQGLENQKDHMNVRQIVGQNFRDEVFRQPINYLVLFYDSKDTSTLQQYEDLLQEYYNLYGEQNKNIMRLGKMDLNLNENELVRLDTAPLFVVYPRHDKSKAAHFVLDLNIENFKLFLKQWVRDINLEEVKEPLQLGNDKIEL